MARSDVWRGSAPTLRIHPTRSRLIAGLAFAATIAAAAILPARWAAAVPGDLDPAFGSHGWVAAPFSSQTRVAMAGYRNGQLVMAGHGLNLATGGNDFVFSRLTTSGQLDTTFGHGGRTFVDGANQLVTFVQEKAIGGGILPDGRMVEFAWDLDDFGGMDVYETRLLPDGAVDTSFGTNGVRVFSLSTAFGVPEAAVVDGQGRAYLAMYYSPKTPFLTDLAVFRIKPAGGIDTTYGAHGLATANIGRQDAANALAIDPAGRIVVVGSTYDDTAPEVHHHLVMARFTTAGTLDQQLDGDGKVETTFPSGDTEGWSVSFDASNRILVGVRDGSAAGAARYSGTGALDHGFGTNGVATLPVDAGNSFFITAAGVASSGENVFVLAGGDGVFVERFTSAGDPDPTWGGDGRVDIPNMDDEQVLLVRNGAPTAVGQAFAIDGRPVGSRMAATQLTAQGQIVHSFGDSGLATVAVYGTNGGEGAEAAAAFPGGGAIVGVDLSLTIPNAYGLLKLLPDGTPDPSFGDDGRVEVPSEGSLGPAGGVAVLSDGDILLAGSDNRAQILRFDPTGDLHTSWGGGDGILTSDSMFAVDALVVLPDDGFFIAGETPGNDGVQRQIAVAEFHPDGTPVTGFGDHGVEVFGFGAKRSDIVSSMVLDGQGRPVLLVTSGDENTGVARVGIARLTTAGLPDTSFSGDGRALIGPSGSTAGGLALDGTNLVASGTVCAGSCGSGTQDAAAFRVTPAGELDASFGTNGMRAVNFGGDDGAGALAVDAQHRVLIGGSTYRQVNGRDTVAFAAARLLPGGGLDGAFGLHGVMREMPPSTYAGMSDLVSQPGGDYLAVGGGLSEGVVAVRLMGSGAGIGPRDVLVQSRAVVEGDSGRKTVGVAIRLSAPLGVATTVYPFVSGGTASSPSDFTARAPKLRIPAGSSSATFPVTVFGDRRVERDETVRIRTNTDEELVPHGGVLTIRNDD